MEWFRHYHGLCTDPKLHEIARKTRVSRGMVIAAWCAVLESASSADDRGVVSISDMQLAFMIDAKPAVAGRIMEGFRDLQMVVDGRVSAWSKRQRECDDVRVRVNRHRDRKNNLLKNNETGCHGNVTVTYRTEQNREEKDSSSNHTQPIEIAENTHCIEKYPIPPLPPPLGFVEDPEPPITPEPRRPKKSSTPSDAFDRFWAAVPRKIGRKACEAKFAIAARTVDPERLIAAMQRYADRCREQGTEERYICHPLTWLNQGRWDDGVSLTPAADADDAGRILRVREIITAAGVSVSTVPRWAELTEAEARALCARPPLALAVAGGQRSSGDITFLPFSGRPATP